MNRRRRKQIKMARRRYDIRRATVKSWRTVVTVPFTVPRETRALDRAMFEQFIKQFQIHPR